MSEAMRITGGSTTHYDTRFTHRLMHRFAMLTTWWAEVPPRAVVVVVLLVEEKAALLPRQH